MRDGIRALMDAEPAFVEMVLSFHAIVKPVRGRGSQGVPLVNDAPALRAAATQIQDAETFGDMLMVEEYLDGEEMTVTVMPPASPRPDGGRSAGHWALCPVQRFNQADGGVAPYHGDVPVSVNSAALSEARFARPADHGDDR